MSSGIDFMDYDSTGKVTGFLCGLCFDWVRAEFAWTCPHSVKWDNCIPCGEINGCGHLLPHGTQIGE